MGYETHQVIEEIPNHHERRLGPDNARPIDVIGRTVEDADDDLQRRKKTQAPVVDCATSEMNEEKPREDCSKKADGEEAHTHIKRFRGGESGHYGEISDGAGNTNVGTHVRKSRLRIRRDRCH